MLLSGRAADGLIHSASAAPPLHTHFFMRTRRSVIAPAVWKMTGLHLFLHFTYNLCCTQKPVRVRGGAFLHRTSIQMCVCRHSVSCQALRLLGSKVHQAGRRCCGLIECWFRPAGRERSSLLNHSTNAFIHLQNSAINFGAGVRTFGEIWPVIASQSCACSFSHSPDGHSKLISRLMLYSHLQLQRLSIKFLLFPTYNGAVRPLSHKERRAPLNGTLWKNSAS